MTTYERKLLQELLNQFLINPEDHAAICDELECPAREAVKYLKESK